MKTYLGILLGSLYLIAPGVASAQLSRSRPAVSPYLNLLQGGQTAGLNYYNLVRPEIDYRASILRLQQQSQVNEQALSDLQSTILPTTGHAAAFMAHGNYFQSFTGGPAGVYGTSGGVGGGSFGTTGGASGRPMPSPLTPPPSGRK